MSCEAVILFVGNVQCYNDHPIWLALERSCIFVINAFLTLH